MDFLHKSNGHENGWRRKDHQMFIKLNSKYKDCDILATNLNELLPGESNSRLVLLISDFILVSI